jgi:hypothetical protein
VREFLEPRLQKVPGRDGAVHTTESSVVWVAAGKGTGKKSRILFRYWCSVVQGCDSTTDKVSRDVLEGVVRAVVF